MSETVYKTVVLYKGLHASFVNEVSEYMDTQYPRVSEELEIALTLLPKEDQINNQVEMLDKEMEEIRTNSLKKLDALSLRKQELLAIGYEGENNV
jgi:hypothetical protein